MVRIAQLLPDRVLLCLPMFLVAVILEAGGGLFSTLPQE